MGKTILGIDIGGTNTKFGVVDSDGYILFRFSIKTKGHEKIDDLLMSIKTKLEEKNLMKDISAVGIGAPNGNHLSGTIEMAPNLEWAGKIEVVKIAEKIFNKNTVLTNDANAAAIGEKVFGNAKGINDFVLITLGTGLGSGFVVNGEVLYGHDGFAGELGHTTVTHNGRQCTCGRFGCLETYVSARGMVKTVWKMLSKYETDSVLKDYTYNKITPFDIYTAAKDNNDEIALKAFDYTAEILAIKLTDVIASTSPKAIFLFGGIAASGDYLFKPLDKYLDKYLHNIYKGKVSVLPSGLEPDTAGILGAAALVMDI